MKTINSNEFNIVIDKGTLDSILCGDDSEANTEIMMSEINRVLCKDGYYICISYGDRERRESYLVNIILKVT